jgi:hypothetical protein
MEEVRTGQVASSHPLERKIGCGFNRADGGWAPHHIAANNNDIFKIEDVENFWRIWNNLVTPKNLQVASEFYFFVEVPGYDFAGPLNEKWDGVIFGGEQIEKVESIDKISVNGKLNRNIHIIFNGKPIKNIAEVTIEGKPVKSISEVIVNGKPIDNVVIFDGGAPIRNIAEIIVNVKHVRRFTPEQIIQIFEAATLFLIGCHSKYEHKILGIRLKVDRSKTNKELMNPQLRLWVAVDKNTQEGQTVIDTIKTEFINSLCRDEISFTFSEQILPKFQSEFTDKLASKIDRQFRHSIAKFADPQIDSEDTLSVGEFRTLLIQQLEKESADIVESLEAELGHDSSETLSKFRMELSNLIVDLKKGNNSFFRVDDEVRQQLPREQRDTRGQGRARGKNPRK